MKRFLLAACLSFSFFGANSQCCPYLGAQQLLPANPTTSDSIYLYTEVTTPCLGAYYGYTLTDMDSVVIVEACYYSGMLTALETYYDTINLGVRDPGNFTVQFIAYQTASPSECIPGDTNSTSLQVFVDDVTAVDDFTTVAFECYPVPAGQSLSISSAESIRHVELTDMKGKLVRRINGNSLKTMTLDLSNDAAGSYFITVYSTSGHTGTKKIMHR